MQLILLSKHRGHLAQVSIGTTRSALAVAALAIALLGGAFYGGYRAAAIEDLADAEGRVAEWKADLQAQEAELEATRRQMQQNIDALALRMGQMNAHVMRLDALGSRLTQMAGLEDGEFDFSSPPPLGGPEEVLQGEEMQFGSIAEALDSLDERLSDRGEQLGVLEDFLLDRKLAEEVQPEGRPVSAGYISSRFGQRNDPFTGRTAYHKGLDFAGREGADVLAVGSGIVTWSGPRYGYGELVEVNHGNGYVTRYAHNHTNLVAVGETVKRGQVIARMGDTGRATGPNLHFEVLRNGRAVDPLSFIN